MHICIYSYSYIRRSYPSFALVLWETAAELELIFVTSVKLIFIVSGMPIKCLILSQPA